MANNPFKLICFFFLKLHTVIANHQLQGGTLSVIVFLQQHTPSCFIPYLLTGKRKTFVRVEQILDFWEL